MAKTPRGRDSIIRGMPLTPVVGIMAGAGAEQRDTSAYFGVAEMETGGCTHHPIGWASL